MPPFARNLPSVGFALIPAKPRNVVYFSPIKAAAIYNPVKISPEPLYAMPKGISDEIYTRFNKIISVDGQEFTLQAGTILYGDIQKRILSQTATAKVSTE